MIYEMTIQFRVTDITNGQAWYEGLFQRKPDFIPHEGFAEWEIIPGCWLQVAEGTPTPGNGPLRLGVTDIEAERNRMVNEYGAEPFEVHSRKEVPVKWGTFSDPWGNRIGFFETLDKDEMNERIEMVLKK
ncbi:VOC family protein [Pontibacillus sp. HMF3514]|uniref:VOC family protein n=1 Tax=Pontibacillus sp. HMF3514 TaxID=2692425 RepID=UPI0013204D5D|nr:VOC family protein [Pontibacillus sp. HMF3514]QHE52677.1 VOC family protein [Pontibacillus sp. HMF3514]